MKDVQLGFILMAVALFVGGCLLAYRKTYPRRQFGRRGINTICVCSALWYIGSIAAHPSFVTHYGSNAYVTYAFLVAWVSLVVLHLSYLVWFAILHGLIWSVERYYFANRH